MLTSGDLAAIKQRCEQATPGPWRAVGPIDPKKHNYRMIEAYSAEEDRPGGDDPWGWIADLGRSTLGERDAEFIAHAREDVPALLARIGQLREALLECIGLHDPDLALPDNLDV